MVRRKSSIFIAAIFTILSFVTITWVSCSKNNDGLVRCEGVVCQNGGYCHTNAVTGISSCSCPTGYEGPYCATASVTKYLGTWRMQQVITGSDSILTIHDTTHYSVSLVQTATPTTFFINNFADNPYYNQILCTIDTNNSAIFTIDTFSAYHMLFDNYKLLYGRGSITSNNSVINGTFAVRHLTSTSNWVNDTITFMLNSHTN